MRYPEIKQIDEPMRWALEHPSFFFAEGEMTIASIFAQLIEGTQVLARTTVESSVLDEWYIVAASDDWFSNARFPVPEDFDFKTITPFPELGANCCRPEFVVATFATDVLVRGPNGTHVVKGNVGTAEQVLHAISGASQWKRAIAFRGQVITAT